MCDIYHALAKGDNRLPAYILMKEIGGVNSLFFKKKQNKHIVFAYNLAKKSWEAVNSIHFLPASCWLCGWLPCLRSPSLDAVCPKPSRKKDCIIIAVICMGAMFKNKIYISTAGAFIQRKLEGKI